MISQPTKIDQIISEIQKKTKLVFKNRELLSLAFIHRSYINEHRQEKLTSNERLEFLGDSILQFWVSRTLYKTFPNLPEGTLTNMRTRLVRTETLADLAQDLSLGEYLFLSIGEERGGGRKNRALLANTFEAFLGAVYLDKNLVAVEKLLSLCFSDLIKELGKAKELKDAKSLLQEKIQTKVKFSPEYFVVSETGPDHDKIFEVEVTSEGKTLGKGKGKSKQEAEEEAARNALENLANLD